jgi:hypothetical protein
MRYPVKATFLLLNNKQSSNDAQTMFKPCTSPLLKPYYIWTKNWQTMVELQPTVKTIKNVLHLREEYTKTKRKSLVNETLFIFIWHCLCTVSADWSRKEEYARLGICVCVCAVELLLTLCTLQSRWVYIN